MNTVVNAQEGRADPAENREKAPAFWLSELTFSDGTAVRLERNSVLVIVGPNNAGKSATLRAINALAQSHDARSPVVRSAVFSRDGSKEEFTDWLNRVPTRNTEGAQTSYSLSGATVHGAHAIPFWEHSDRQGLRDMARWFCLLLSAESRMQASNSPTTIDRRTGQPPTHPVHLLQLDEALAAKASKLFRKAFGTDLIVDSTPSSNAHLLCGTAPPRAPGEDRLSSGYLKKLADIPLLMRQGDGMRSFTGVTLHLIAGHESMLLIDEPEAFLHPPQARLLGRTLVESKRMDCQLIVATHSSDLVRGMLDALNDDVYIVRIRRDGKANVARHLSAKQVRELWGDPLLRYSNILDGLFHERTVVCESDADCRFYSAVIDAMSDKKGEDARHPDILFTHVGGKDRIPVAVRALMQVAVPVTAIADFDVLRDEELMRKLVESFGEGWPGDLRSRWSVVKTGVESIKPELSVDDVRNGIEKALASLPKGPLPATADSQIRSVLNQASPWRLAKQAGTSYLPAGEVTKTANELLAALHGLGLWVVPVGEIERFCPSIGGHGPKWVNSVLEKNLASDPELRAAREFVAELANAEPPSALVN